MSQAEHESGLARVERAAGDLRRGLVVVIAENGRDAALVLAAELASEPRLKALRDLAGAEPDLALTHRRAGTLKIRLST